MKGHLGLGFNEAPAERGGKRVGGRLDRGAQVASMRPPLNAGENTAWSARGLARPTRFNEAPAERGGKLVTTDHAYAFILELQ